jgi:hypothetical protein
MEKRRISCLYQESVISFVNLHWIIEVKADKKRRASVYIKCLMETEKFTDNTKHKEH